MKKAHLLWSIVIWSSILLISFAWNYYLANSSNNKLVLNKTRAFFEQILITRAWNAEHGGVYVPVTTKTQPNQHLEDSLRDVTTVDGMMLTKINPAYMTRQIAETNSLKNDLQFHITSLKPIRPANNADAWESKSLKMFENGVTEHLELVVNDSSLQYRYMAPLVTGKSCLKCHSKQGYKPGDIRGGISISFPAREFTESVRKQTVSFGFIHLIILILGITGLMVYYRMTNKYMHIIEHRNNELAQMNATKDKFFSIIGHDLKAPFNSILGFSEILIDQINTGDYDSIEKYAKIIHESSERATLLLGNLLQWSLTQTGKIQFNPQRFDLLFEINEARELLHETAAEKSITINTETPDSVFVFADKEMISTVLRNLISNAIKFSQQNGRITITARTLENELIVKIDDKGVGIPKDRIEKLFTVGENYSTRGTQNEEGTGLGLILCKEFIEANNGKIWAESIVGSGSSFYFSLPATPAF